MVSKQLASVSGSGRFFTCRGKHLANTCAPKCAQPGAPQACKGPRPEAEAEAEAELEAEVEACARCATCVSRRCAAVCIYAFWSLPARSSRRLPACLRPLCKQIKWANGRMDVLFVVLSPVRRQPWQQLRELATANVFVKSRAAGELPLKTAKTETPRRTQRTQLSCNSRREDEEKKWPKVLQIS